ncbi:MAG: MFS transporter [Desulfoarculaceae bacterium]|nr:MFS transporter [Desulfoarculaceae bacterium]
MPAIPVSFSSTDAQAPTEKTAFTILAIISVCHLLNDMMQTLLSAIYPLLQSNYGLNFTQIGLITLTFQGTGSILQPMVGFYIDRNPRPYSLAAGMGLTLVGLALFSQAGSFATLLLAAALVGTGSSVFHPESSRVARMASGGRHGLAQSLFQVGGNAGAALGPLLAALIVFRHGQTSVAWFSVAALLAIYLLIKVGHWYKGQGLLRLKSPPPGNESRVVSLPRGRVALTLVLLLVLLFSKFFYMASMGSYYIFYLMDKFHLPVQSAQLYLFVFYGAVAVGTISGGPLGDRFGRRVVIWISILGALPFTLALPYVDLFWTGLLSVVIGVIFASAFPAIVVYAQELLPNRVGAVSGMSFGFAFGMAGIGAALLGHLADRTSLAYVYHLCSFLPAIGLLAIFLPDLETESRRRKRLDS